MIVVDASLAVKWLMPESDSPDAMRFLELHRGNLCGPDLLFSEVAGAIVRRANMGVVAPDEALEALQIWTAGW